jgi:hypothetical protein
MNTCEWCDEPIDGPWVAIPHGGAPGRIQVFFHSECFFRSVAGSVAHQERRCSCFGGNDDEDPTLSKRESAKAAFELFRKMHPAFE